MRRLAHVLTLALALSATAAHADAKKDKALALFEKSDKAYKDGNFEHAAKLLEEAYGLYPEPILLYNLGRAQEGLGDVEGAIASYEKYLEDGKDIADRGAIERRIETLKAQLAAREEEKERLAAEEKKRKRAEEDKKRAEEERLRIERERAANEPSPLQTWGPWATMGTGVLVVATGFYFGARASSTHDDAVATPVQRDAIELQDSAERSASIANVMFVVGGVVIAGGIGWKIWQWKTGADTTVTVAPTPTGGAVEWTW